MKNTTKNPHQFSNTQEELDKILDEIELLTDLEKKQLKNQEAIELLEEEQIQLEKRQLRKQNTNYLSMLNAMKLAVVLLLIVAGISIAQYQAIYRTLVAPNAPESAPLAGYDPSCTYNWSVYPEETPKLTPTPTPSTCENCDYQVDVYWGPVIKSFKENGKTYRYSNSGPSKKNRLISTRKSLGSDEYPKCALGSLVPNDGVPTVDAFPCNGKDDPKKYLTASINTSNLKYNKGGYVTAQVKNTHPSCAYTVGLASYRADASLPEQEFYNTQEYITHADAEIPPGQTVTLAVPVAELGEKEQQCQNIPNKYRN